ncbi:MAG: dihydropteroate synthase [Myxococcaceae bacterium]
MILARPIALDRSADLDAALVRLGLPTPAREYLLEKLPHAQVLLTGLGPSEGRFLKHTCEEGPAGLYPRFLSGDQALRPGTAFLSGARDQLARLVQAARQAPEASPLADALARLLAVDCFPEPTLLAGRRFLWGERTYLMGVLNVTPDSFSDGGLFSSVQRAVAHGLALADAGADLVDIGGESTRPGAAEVPADQELKRILPVIEGLRAQSDIPLSIDTSKAGVAEAALAAGATLVNDVTGFLGDARLPAVTAAAGAAVCLMHMQGTPRTMQHSPHYEDLMADVLEMLGAAVGQAEAAGIPRGRIWVDPGIGFGKTSGHNLFLLHHVRELRLLGCPVVLGTSRKAFLGALAGGKSPDQRLPGTLASVAASAVVAGVDVVRVHDVGEVRDALAVADAIGRARSGGALWAPTAEAQNMPGT